MTTPPANLPPSALDAIKAEVTDSWGSYVTGLTNGFGDLFEGNAARAAEGFREIGHNLTAFATDLSNRIGLIAEGWQGNSAERAAIQDIAHDLSAHADAARAAGLENFGRAAATEAMGAVKAFSSEALGSAADLFNMSDAALTAYNDGTPENWAKLGGAATGVLLSIGAATLAAYGVGVIGG